MGVKIVRSIQVNPDTVDLAYMDEDDVRCQGHVFSTHHISIERDGNYDNEIEALEAAAEALLMDVLTDFNASLAYDPMLAMQERYARTDEDEDADEAAEWAGKDD